MSGPSQAASRRGGLRGSAFLALAAGAILALWAAIRLTEYPSDRAAALRQHPEVGGLVAKDLIGLEKDLLQYETDSRIKIGTAVVQAFAGGVLLLGLLFTWLNLRATQAKLDIDREGQLTNRFTQAAGQLGAELKEGTPNIEVRLGAIYALARIAHDSPRDYGPIMDVLTAYVRQNAPWPPPARDAETRHAPWPPPAHDLAAQPDPAGPHKPRTDVQAILTILGRSAVPKRRLDLRRTDLRGAEFWDARLDGTDFWGARLDGAHLWGADLRGTKLEKASLKGANLRDARLSGAILTGACLEEADIRGADLTGAVELTQEQVDRSFREGAEATLPAHLTRKRKPE